MRIQRIFSIARFRNKFFSSACLFAALAILPQSTAQADGSVTFQINDKDGQPLSCRIHVKDEAGKPQRAAGLPFWRDHFVCPGKAELQLPDGNYTYLIERGPEYARVTGSFQVTASKSAATVKQTIKRIAHMANMGWYSGDLHVHRSVDDVPLLMQAEDLNVAPVITWWNSRNLWENKQLPEDALIRLDNRHVYHVMAGEDERAGGALMYYNLSKPLPITKAAREYPSPLKFVAAARKYDGVWIDIEKPFWWDVPTWLASGQIDSIGIANNHMCHSTMYENEAWGKPRDEDRLPSPRGNGFWTQEIYYHVLNCGLRVPPSAGSASGVLPNPVGYNRAYVHVGDDFSYDNWWAGLKAGRSFVTNGPLLVVKADGHLPGHVFQADASGALEIPLDVSLTTNDDVPQLEIIKNGKIVRTVSTDDLGAVDDHTRSGSAGTIRFRESGWFLIRALADNQHTFRFASTAPFYVEVGEEKRRISSASAKFFVDWVDERITRVREALEDPDQEREVVAHHIQAKKFWQQKLDDSTAP